MIKTQLTKRVTQISEHTAVCQCYTFILDGVKVLQAFKGYLYASNPIYSRFDGSGVPNIEISKSDFKAELERIMKLD